MTKKFLIALSLVLCTSQAFAKKVWIDADTGNEMDDVYAIVRILAEPSVEVVGISSAHFNNPDLLVFDKWNQYPTAGIRTVEISQKLNEEMIKLMGKTNVPTYLGADRQIGRAWGGYQPRPSKATSALIQAVRSLPEGEYLDVIMLGALTNLASAVAIDPSITPKIRCYLLGAKFNVTTQVWNKNEFNIRNDLNAFDYLLNSEMPLFILPVDVVLPFQVAKDETYAKLDPASPVHQYLKNRWEETNPQDAKRVLWDLGIIEAYLKPELFTLTIQNTPPENRQRKVGVYTKMDVQQTIADFWRVVLPLKGNPL
jgi:purine nucleosidase